MDLFPIHRPDFDVDLAIAYATADNISGAPIYRRAAAYLHREAVDHLARAIELASAVGLRFRVFDAFRPTEAQAVLWRHCPNPEFIADPRSGSPHSRGAAIDLTLIDGAGQALEMGTGFDALTPLSRHANTAVSATAQRNRALLLGIMTAAGWDFYRNEWWHYQLFAPRRLPLLSDSVLPNPMMGPEPRR